MGSQRLRNFAAKCYGCCTCPPVFAGQKGRYFNAEKAQEKRQEWKNAVKHHLPTEHKPIRVPENLDDQEHCEDGNAIFTDNPPLFVFANEDDVRIKKQAQKLKDLQAGSSQPGTSTGRGNKTAVVLEQGTRYDPENMIFEGTVPPGHYIEARRFMTYYAKKSNSRDNRNHKLDVVTLQQPRDLGPIQGLVGTDYSHCSTSDRESATHADLYMKKTKGWACVAAISNHTGEPLEGHKQTKLERDATFKP